MRVPLQGTRAATGSRASYSRIKPLPAASFASRQVRPPAPNLDTDGARSPYQPARPTRQLAYFWIHITQIGAHIEEVPGKDPHFPRALADPEAQVLQGVFA